MVQHLEAGLADDLLAGSALHRKERVVHHADLAFAVNNNDSIGHAVDQVLTITVTVHARRSLRDPGRYLELILIVKRYDLRIEPESNLSQKIRLFKHIRKGA